MLKRIKEIGRTLYKWWIAFGRALGIVNATILLTVVYIIVIGPMFLIGKLLRKDPMGHKLPEEGSLWRVKEIETHTVDHARHQF